MEDKHTISAEGSEQTLRQISAQCIEKNPECQKILDSLRKTENFLDDFRFLTLERGFIRIVSDNDVWVFSLSRIATSLTLTMGSIISCCESACIADANTLLRKYRDDLFFYLFISTYNGFDANSKEAKSLANQIIKWLNNDLTDLQIGQVLKAIAQVPQIKDAVEKYKLKKSFDAIGKALNNYVHSNGRSYYNQRYADYILNDKLIDEIRKIESNARYITVTFLLLLIICSPGSIMAEDYIDYLDCNETPPANSQYWVAPFIEQFVKQNISLIDPNCLEYLRENTEMQI